MPIPELSASPHISSTNWWSRSALSCDIASYTDMKTFYMKFMSSQDIAILMSLFVVQWIFSHTNECMHMSSCQYTNYIINIGENNYSIYTNINVAIVKIHRHDNPIAHIMINSNMYSWMLNVHLVVQCLCKYKDQQEALASSYGFVAVILRLQLLEHMERVFLKGSSPHQQQTPCLGADSFLQ